MIAGAATRASLVGDAPLVHMDDGRRRSGAELHARVSALARLLAARGLAGRRIGAWYQNSFAVLEAHLAIEWIGATRVPVDPAAPAAEAQQVFDVAEVELVVADSTHAALLGGDVLIHDDDWPAGVRGTLESFEVDEDTVLHWFPRAVSDGRLHGIPVTYGNWEALMHTHTDLYRRGAYGPALGDSGECFLTAQQVMHGTSMIGTYPFLRLGLPQVMLERFNAEKAIEVIERFGVTSTMFVPGMLTRLAAVVDGPLPLRRLLYGGAPIERTDLLRCIEVFGDVLVQLYGRWEGGWPISILDGADHVRIAADPGIEIAGSAGRPIPDVEVRLRDHGGGRQELCVRSPMVVRAYADPDGWFALGDLARLDDGGYLYLLGRLDGQISTGAYHVYPGEIEEALLALGPVVEARVTGEPDPAWGEIVTAYVVTSEDRTEEQLRLALRSRLAPYKIPRRMYFVDELPRSATA